MSDIDYDALDPGIREAVRWLRGLGYWTTDSGDGVTKPAEEQSVDGPHVSIVIPWVDRDRPIEFTNWLWKAIVKRLGHEPDLDVQAMYNPADQSTIILVCGNALFNMQASDV